MHRRGDGRDPDGPGRPLSHPLRPAPERGAEPGAGVPAGGNAEPGNDRAGAAGGVRQQALVLAPRLSPGSQGQSGDYFSLPGHRSTSPNARPSATCRSAPSAAPPSGTRSENSSPGP